MAASAQFTVISSNGRHFTLPLNEARHSLTLACLIPSTALSCLLPASCTDASIQLALRCLHLLDRLPFPAVPAMHGSLDSGIPAEYRQLADGLGQREVGEMLLTCSVLRLEPLSLMPLWESRSRQLREEARGNVQLQQQQNEAQRAFQQSQQASMDVQLPSSASTAATAAPPTAETRPSFAFVSSTGTRHELPAALASLSPVAAQLMDADTHELPLADCDDSTLTLVNSFLSLLASTPLLVHNGGLASSIQPGTALSELVPPVYAALFDGQFASNDGSYAKVCRAVNALQLHGMALVVQAKREQLMANLPREERAQRFAVPGGRSFSATAVRA